MGLGFSTRTVAGSGSGSGGSGVGISNVTLSTEKSVLPPAELRVKAGNNFSFQRVFVDIQICFAAAGARYSGNPAEVLLLRWPSVPGKSCLSVHRFPLTS
jgi:hypothetical protein